jgi:hypothetical protein
MQKSYVALLFSVAAFTGAYFQYRTKKNFEKENSDTIFHVGKIVVNVVLGIIALLLFVKDF